MSNPILCTATPVRANLRFDQDHEFYAMVSFHPPESTAERPKLELSVALDVSSSMRGDKLTAAKDSLLKLVEHLAPSDKLAVVEFGSNVETLFGLTPMTPDNKRKAISAIHAIACRGMTNLSGGLFKALEHLTRAAPTPGTVRRCLLFTDGQANKGITDSTELAEAALEYRGKIAISTFGYGNGHDEELLRQLSQDGSFYYIDIPDKILASFGAELGGLLSTFAQNVELRLTPAKGIQIAEVLNDLTVTEDGADVIISCGDLLAGVPLHVVLRIQSEARQKTLPRPVSIIKGSAHYYEVAGRTLVDHAVKLQVRFVPKAKADTDDDKRVLEEVALQKLVAAQAKAIELSDLGNFAGAQGLLRGAARFANDVGTSAARDYAKLADGVAEAHDWAAYQNGGRKLAASTHGTLRRRRSGARGTDVGGVDLGGLFSTQTVDELVDDFTGAEGDDTKAKPETPVAKPETPVAKPKSSLSKRATSTSW